MGKLEVLKLASSNNTGEASITSMIRERGASAKTKYRLVDVVNTTIAVLLRQVNTI